MLLLLSVHTMFAQIDLNLVRSKVEFVQSQIGKQSKLTWNELQANGFKKNPDSFSMFYKQEFYNGYWITMSISVDLTILDSGTVSVSSSNSLSD